jgi:CubicO group peptidase (beta-lactamase class C family)
MNGFWFPNGYNNVYYSNARSFARFGLLLLNKATWNNTVVLADTNYFHDMTNTSQNINESYGYLTWLNGKQSYMLPESQLVFQGSFLSDAPADLFAALGKNGQVINVVPSMNLVLIRMGNAPTTNAALPMLLNNQIWQKLNEAMCNTALTNKPVTNKSFVIFPNPVNDLLDVLIDCDVHSYKISQLNGSVILSGATLPVKVTSLETGIYFLEFEGDKIKYHTKFLKE